MMIKRNLIYALLTGVLLLASCSSEETVDKGVETLPGGKYPINITATGLEITPTSRVTADGIWEENNVVAVQLSNDDGYNVTKQYKVTATNATTTLECNDEKGDNLYWQTTADSYKIKAWSCFKGTYYSSFPSLLEVKQDQSGEGYRQSDFLYAYGTLSYTEKDNPLTFYHQTANVVVHVISGEDTPKDMSITGMKTGELNIKRERWTAPPTETDKFYGSGGSASYLVNITPHEFEAGKVTLPGTEVQKEPLKSYKFLIVPQTVNYGYPLFTITAQDYEAPFIYTPTANITWEAGREYTYYITIKGSKVTATVTTTKIGWTGEGATGEGSVDI